MEYFPILSNHSKLSDTTGKVLDENLYLGLGVDGPALDLLLQKSSKESEGYSLGAGIPARYADRKSQLAKLPSETTQVIFWIGSYELVVYNSNPRFSEIITILKA